MRTRVQGTRRRARRRSRGKDKGVTGKGTIRTGWQVDGPEGPREELGTKILKVGWQERMALVRGGKQVGPKAERGGWSWGVGSGLKDGGDR